MEITGESEEVVRGAFLDVGNNKNEEIINYILDNKGKLVNTLITYPNCSH